MSYDLDNNYLAAIQFVKRSSEGYEREEGYSKTFANSMADKAGIAQRNTLLTLMIQTLQKLENLEELILQLQNKEVELDIDRLTNQLSSTLKISTDKDKRKKHVPNTFFYVYT